MEQFSIKSSRIFGAASFANFYNLFPIVLLRIIFLVSLVSSILINSETAGSLFYFSIGVFLIFVAFEIFFKGKILAEKSLPLNANKGNLADSITLDSARLLLKSSINDPKSILTKLVQNPKVRFVLEKAEISGDQFQQIIQGQENTNREYFKLLLEQAIGWAKKEKRETIDKLDFFLAILTSNNLSKEVLFKHNIKEEDLLNIIYWSRDIFDKGRIPFWMKSTDILGPGIADVWVGGWTPETEKYAIDLTKKLGKEIRSQVMVGKENEIIQIEEILSRSEKRNAILIGEPGIGKTSLVRALAQKSVQGSLPQSLLYKRFLQLDLTALLSGAGGGDLEQRLQNLLTELSHAGNVILYLPNIENLAGSAGTGTNITGHLIEALSSDKLQIIATSTKTEYRRIIEPQSSFSALFETIQMREPDINQTIRILEQATNRIEFTNKLSISYKAIQKATLLSDRYVVDRVLPGKAIDLLDEAATGVAIKKKKILESSDIEDILSQKTKLPIQTAVGAEADKLVHLEQVIHQRIVDQEEAVSAVSNALRRARSIEREGNKPIGTFLFLGPTGVGKTETAKAIASLYFGDEDAVTRVDMSQYQSEDAINRLIGSPPGTGKYEEGGEFTESIRQKPYCLILLDEMEKANSKILDAFLPIFDEGVIEDVTGRKILFTNAIIIATSNAGAEYIRESVQQNIASEILKKNLLEKLQKEGVFKPEFLNRFDEIIVYKPLGKNEIVQIVKMLLTQLSNRLAKQDIQIKVSEEALAWVSERGYDPTYGARPLKRFIADNVEGPIAEKILKGELSRGSTVSVTSEQNTLSFSN